MTQLPQILESFKKIRFQDCDPFNHLNNGRYVDYFINAREDQLLTYYDIDLFKIIQEQGLGWVVSNNKIAYLKPVFTMEEVCIQSQLICYDSRSIEVEMRMWNKDKTILKTVAWFGFAPFHLKKNRVEPHTDDFMEIFESVVLSIPQKVFEQRVLYLKNNTDKIT